jgi:RNA polymerase sigma-70 factor (ECF subfamily)
LTEAEIIERAQNGDEAMFEQLYRRHSRRVYAVCVRMVKDPTEAEDLTQEAFMLVFRNFTPFAANRLSPPGCTVWLSTAS